MYRLTSLTLFLLFLVPATATANGLIATTDDGATLAQLSRLTVDAALDSASAVVSETRSYALHGHSEEAETTTITFYRSVDPGAVHAEIENSAHFQLAMKSRALEAEPR